ncbi:anti-sigma factor [Paenibacillus arenilitoris]|uniref:Anti-sigma-W factor RsiW n=1 Tax=Paenibacillus arenilitoris TaxID=2772299 RepID=A0A927CJI7_9BACL|nr:anti-sigma factor [Paenibacillus arenilitoris]MBD2868674.1 anti-sigma factor [Paenibacillus arenilitoris]
MQDNGHDRICSIGLDYVSGVCSGEEKQAFERHLPDCAECRAEIDELCLVWEAFPGNMERIEPPKDLKKQVMAAALAADAGNGGPVARRPAARRWFARAAIAAAAIAFVAGSVWNYGLYRERTAAPLTVEQALDIPAASIERLVSLKPETAGAARSYGVACIVDNGNSKQFIVYVFGAEATTDTQAYQVWLLEDGKRRSAGTFRVDERGIGVLSLPIASGTLTFDAIGITLEPDDSGDSPRGEKKFGSV